MFNKYITLNFVLLSEKYIKVIEMGLKWFRGQISMQKKSPTLSFTPEFYRKISQTDISVTKLHKNTNDNLKMTVNTDFKQLNTSS